ncbi:hypothetical protein MJO28_007531 [Puccinia striiformis f. sp. tritici]|uniref:Uncharacterized protein n=1 Tax=Puccinia striiformis f. sp. tritici TaxID=168172 RepID=A0ACC0EG70_9BASI|nr:hypothetical protein MJO28_007531 [Puccinia striiformis f. sp. tritici]
MTDADISEEDGYASSDWEPRENVKPRFYIPSEPSSALIDVANITKDSCHIAEEDRYASSDWEPRENIKPRFYIPSEPSSALIDVANIADDVDPFANGSPEGLTHIEKLNLNILRQINENGNSPKWPGKMTRGSKVVTLYLRSRADKIRKVSRSEQRIARFWWPCIPCATAVAGGDARIGMYITKLQISLSKWLKAEDSIGAKHQESSHDATKRIQTLTYPKFEAALSEWMTQAVHYSLHITGEIIKEKWQDFARLDGIPSEEWLKLSSGWLESFKNRHQLQNFRKHGEAASADITVVESEIIRMQEITKDYNLKNIFNMDKTGLFYSMPLDVGLAFKATHGVKSNKTRLTLALTCNADGSEKKPLLFIGKSKKPRSFKGRMAKYYKYEYAHKSTAWMTAEIFQRWLKSWNSTLKEEDRNILLLLDNF